MEDPKKKTTFVEVVKATKGIISQTGRCVHPNSIGRALNRGVGTCFAEVEMDTWTGDWRCVRAAYCNGAGHVMNPLLASADQNGSLVQSTSITTDGIPWDREFPGTLHCSMGYLSCRLPTIMEPPEQINVLINSLKPRWFFGSKGFAETAIGAALRARWRMPFTMLAECGSGSTRFRKTRSCGFASQKRDCMKPVSVYRPASLEEAIQI